MLGSPIFGNPPLGFRGLRNTVAAALQDKGKATPIMLPPCSRLAYLRLLSYPESLKPSPRLCLVVA